MNIDRRAFLASAGAASASLPLLAAGELFAQSGVQGEDAILATVNPELRPMAKGILRAFRNEEPLSRATLEKTRAANRMGSKPLADVPFERRTIPGGRGQPEVAVYIVNARAGAWRPAILHTHGGGYVAGSAAASVLSLQALCRELDCVAVSVEYRLAPETTFAGSVEDNYAGLKWLHANAPSLGADPARIAVMGESAGGGHAALLAIAARDRGEVPVRFQCLTYPMLDDRTGSSRPVPPHVGQIIWNAQKNRFGWESFLGARPGGRSVPAGVPARVASVKGLPPGWIGVGSIDLFHDEDVDYAQRLNDAGVPTELIVVPGAFHGFESPLFGTAIGRWFVAARTNALRRGLAA